MRTQHRIDKIAAQPAEAAQRKTGSPCYNNSTTAAPAVGQPEQAETTEVVTIGVDEVECRALKSCLLEVPNARDDDGDDDDENGDKDQDVDEEDQREEEDDPLPMAPPKKHRRLEAKATKKSQEWTAALSSKPSLGAGLIVPSINHLKSMGEKKEEERPNKEPIQSLLQDLSNQEKQILKQIFISNKIGEATSWTTYNREQCHKNM